METGSNFFSEDEVARRRRAVAHDGPLESATAAPPAPEPAPTRWAFQFARALAGGLWGVFAELARLYGRGFMLALRSPNDSRIITVMSGVTVLGVVLALVAAKMAVNVLSTVMILCFPPAVAGGEPAAAPAPASAPAAAADSTAPTRGANLGLNDPGNRERAARGKRLFDSLKNRIPVEKNPEMRGQMSSSPTLTLYVTNQVWKGLSKEQQIDLTWYAESMVSTARSNPEAYNDVPPDAPLYPRFLNITRGLCDDCWTIILGNPKRGQRGMTMSIDSTAVRGDTAWELDDSVDRGAKASDFRAGTKVMQVSTRNSANHPDSSPKATSTPQPSPTPPLSKAEIDRWAYAAAATYILSQGDGNPTDCKPEGRHGTVLACRTPWSYAAKLALVTFTSDLGGFRKKAKAAGFTAFSA